jgi:hypothetical protein
MYYVVYGLLWLLSLLPLRLLYVFSDACYGILFYIMKYRRDIVMGNLQTAFPDAEGRFAFGNLRSGRYYVSAQAASETQARWVTDIDRMLAIDARGGAATDIELPVPASKP